MYNEQRAKLKLGESWKEKKKDGSEDHFDM
jgi:hypothetical protein